MYKKLNRFTDFMSWLVKQYREVLDYTSKNYPFRIVSERLVPRTGETIFTIQFVGKSTCPKITATELAEDNELIEGFAPKDVKRIVKAAISKSKMTIMDGGLNQETHRIVAKNFGRGGTNPTYIIEFIDEDGATITKTLSIKDFIKRKDLLHKFGKKDIYDIAYTAGANSILTEQIDIK